MAKTTFDAHNALTKKVWEEKLFRDTQKETYFAKFEGKGAESLVQVKDQLSKSKGDTVTFGIRMRLQEAGVTSGQVLEGNEESLNTHDFKVSLEQYRHAVRDAGALDRQRAMFSIDEESKAALKSWAAEKKDSLCFEALAASPTSIFYPTAEGAKFTTDINVAKSALTENMRLTPKLIDFVKAWAITGGGRKQIPLRPVKVKGHKHFVMLLPPDVAYDLRQNAQFFTAIQNALPRGESNPIFSGALGMYNGVILHEHENVPIAADAGSTKALPYGQCFFMGAQSLVWANGKRWSVRAKNFDYDNEHGYSIDTISGVGKPKFDGKDYGSLNLFVARTQISDV